MLRLLSVKLAFSRHLMAINASQAWVNCFTDGLSGELWTSMVRWVKTRSGCVIKGMTVKRILTLTVVMKQTQNGDIHESGLNRY